MTLIEVKVPDIGDFDEVPVIELFVKAGDSIQVEEPICTLESDKATMDVPSSAAGTVKEVHIKVGSKVAEGSVLITVEAQADAGQAAETAETSKEAPAAAPAQAQSTAAAAPAPAAASHAGGADIDCDVLVLGAGPGGYSAAFRAADLGLKAVIVERYPTLGGVCLNVGCIPSKALLHVAGVMDEVSHFADLGIEFSKPKIQLDKLRSHKEKVVGKLTGGLAGMAKGRKVEVVQGIGQFLDPHHVEVQLTTGQGKEVSGEKKVVKFKQAIIAAGSQAVKLPFMPDDPRVVDSTGALELQAIPKKMLVIGGGIIGLEMATVYSTLGARIDVVEMQDGLMQGADRDLVKVWEKVNAHRFDKVMLKTKTVSAEAKKDGIWVSFEGENAPTEAQCYDLVLVAVGRSPNGLKLAADKAGLAVSERGFIEVDNQQRSNVPHIFAIGDIVGQPMLPTKPCMKAMWPPKSQPARSRISTPCRSLPSPIPTRKWLGPA